MQYDLSFLDDIMGGFERTPNKVPELHVGLVEQLYRLRQKTRLNGWSELRTKIISHPIREILHQDPFTYRSFSKPRGYPGDAVLLDYMYCHEVPQNTTELGQKLFTHCIDYYQPCKAVRHRRELVARKIDELGEHDRHLRILSVACGHLREASLSKVIANGDYSEFVALDHDLESLAEIDRVFKSKKSKIVTLDGSVKDLIRRQVFYPTTRFDFVYAAGLYDYLPQVVAQKLTKSLFDLVDPGGQLLIANVVPDFVEIGYSETFMDWVFVYRNEAELVNVAALIDPSELASILVYGGPHGIFAYLQLTRQ